MPTARKAGSFLATPDHHRKRAGLLARPTRAWCALGAQLLLSSCGSTQKSCVFIVLSAVVVSVVDAGGADVCDVTVRPLPRLTMPAKAVPVGCFTFRRSPSVSVLVAVNPAPRSQLRWELQREARPRRRRGSIRKSTAHTPLIPTHAV